MRGLVGAVLEPPEMKVQRAAPLRQESLRKLFGDSPMSLPLVGRTHGCATYPDQCASLKATWYFTGHLALLLHGVTHDS